MASFYSLAVIEGAQPPSAHGDAVRMVIGTNGPALSSASAEGPSREGRQRPHVLVSCESAPLLSFRLKVVIKCSPRLRRCSNATTSVHRRLWPSVQPVGVGHSEPPVKGSRLWSLEPSAERQQRSAGPHETLRVLWTLWGRSLHVPTPKQEALSVTSEGWVSPSAVGQGSSPGGFHFDGGVCTLGCSSDTLLIRGVYFPHLPEKSGNTVVIRGVKSSRERNYANSSSRLSRRTDFSTISVS